MYTFIFNYFFFLHLQLEELNSSMYLFLDRIYLNFGV